MSEELITINPGECLPGFPSGHGPGDYLVDYEARTIRPVPLATEETATEATSPDLEAKNVPSDGQPIIEQGG
jgi:hypothetical protein